MATMTTYDEVGKKEDVSDIITNISPTKTPFQSMIGSESIRNTLYQWQEDSLMAVAVNAALEGADAPTASWQPTVMRSNYTQILVKTAQVTDSTSAVETYGRSKELAYQLRLRSSEIKRDFENALVGTGQSAVAGSSTTARQLAGYQAQISAGSTNTLGTAAPLTETLILGTAQTLYTNGADPTTLMVKPADSLKVAAMQTTGRTKFIDNDDKAINNVVDVYQSPFGSLKVIINRFQRSSDALIFDPDMWKKLVLRNWTRSTLAKTGDSTNVQLVGEFSLQHKNYGASGVISNLT